MNNKEKNRTNMIAYFQEGCKSEGSTLQYGVEVEHFVVRENGESIAYAGAGGMEEILEKLAPYYTHKQESEGHLIGVYRREIAVSLEPAAQIEVSMIPKDNADDILTIYENFEREITEILQEYGYRMVTLGYQPVSKVDNLSLIPKERYAYMDRYFAQIGPYGRQMMRGTASAQISIDYYNEDDFVMKYALAYGLTPFLARLCENTPFYEGANYMKAGLRQTIWAHTDPRRVDVLPYMEDGKLDFYGYSEFVMQTPVIVNQIGDKVEYSEQTIGDICTERVLSKEELDHVLSMVFPMIRLKNYIEIRVADSMPKDALKRYILLVKGIFTNAEKCSNYLNQLKQNEKDVWDNREEFFGLILESLQPKEREYLEQYRDKIIQEGTII